MKKKIGSILLDYLIHKNVKHVFVLNGGAIAFLIDAFNNRNDINYICVNHEQSAAIMADAYSRSGPGFAATMVTSGPGATNLITGICCSWFDSISNIHICGQVNELDLKDRNLSTAKCRQIGFQETDIVSMTKNITKKSLQLKSVKNFISDLNSLYNISQSDRKGPVLIDIPMNLQKLSINNTLSKFLYKKKILKKYNLKLKSIINTIFKSKKPVLILGAGIRLSNSESELFIFLKKFNIPIVTTWGGFDIISHDYKNYFGNIGVYGQRAANIIVQSSDLIIALGTRLDTRVTGGNTKIFAPKAKKIIIDIDKNELNKNRYCNKLIKINSDLKYFLKEFNKCKINFFHYNTWVNNCLNMHLYISNNIQRKYKSIKSDPYNFFSALNKSVDNNSIYVLDTGAHLTWGMQQIKIKKNQRLFSAFGNSPMGYAIPASIGAALANKNKQIICITGDGSLHVNIQELHLIYKFNLNIKIFILNNDGYGIIKQFQSLYLDGHSEASTKGYSNPDILALGKSYKIKTFNIKNNAQINKVIKSTISYNGPAFVNINIDKNQTIEPKLEFGNSLENLSPIIEIKEFLRLKDLII